VTPEDSVGGARRLLLHRRVQMAVKAALAAALSWVAGEVVARALSSLRLEDYVYYAPLGAVVATYPTVAASWRTARSATVALGLGAALGLVVHGLMEPGPLSLALVVGAGVALGSLPGMGAQRSWVPIVALFVLVVGGAHTWDYAVAYVGLTALGALCGVLVNLLLPALRLTEGDEALRRLRTALADQLTDLAEGLQERPAPGPRDWERRMHHPRAEAERTQEAVQEVLDARRGNLRAPWHTQEFERQRRLVEVLARIAVLAEDLPQMLMEGYRQDLDQGPLDAELAAVTADALERLADLVRAYDGDLSVDDPVVEDAEEAVQRLTYAFGRRRGLDDADVAVLGAVVANLRRMTAVVDPGRPDPSWPGPSRTAAGSPE
jgi:uncharacterized membrane protein YgaE (UPF0421/DUF939 family)